MRASNNFIKLGDYQIRIQRIETTYIVDLFDNNGVFVSSGKAVKNPKDQFSRKVGRKIAIKHAIMAAGELIPHGERKAIWESYRTSMTKRPRWGQPINKEVKTKSDKLELAS